MTSSGLYFDHVVSGFTFAPIIQDVIFRCMSVSSDRFVTHSISQSDQPQSIPSAYSNLTKAFSVTKYKLLHLPRTIFGPHQS